MNNCKMCSSEINDNSKICKHCGSDQRWIYRFLRTTGLINIVAVVVLLLTFIQYHNARNEKILAQEAQKSAENALYQVRELRDETFSITKLSTELTYLQSYKYTVYASGGIVYPDKFYNDLDSLFELIEPNVIEREKWKESLDNLR